MDISMAKRRMDKIKDYRGSKRAVQKETAEWLAGNIGSIPTRAGSKRAPPFQVEAITALTKKPKASTRVTKTIKSKRSTQAAMEDISTPADSTTLLPVLPIAPNTPTAPPHVLTTKPAATATVQVSQDSLRLSEDESGADDDEGDVNVLDESDTDDAEVQVIVTPQRQPAQLRQEDAEEMTVQQYQLVIADYQDRLLRAERQIRAISKTHLADKFMENEVRKYVKESLWKRCKFITSAETMEHCMNEVAHHFSIAAEKREHWKSTYAHSVRDALNNRRNNTAQDLKKEIAGKCKRWRQWWWLLVYITGCVNLPMTCASHL
jgi:hypothetical protein